MMRLLNMLCVSEELAEQGVELAGLGLLVQLQMMQF